MVRAVSENPDVLPLSGRQYSIACGDYEARVASVGGALRSLTYCGDDVVSPFAANQLMPGMRGAILAPWPNRIRDGVYTFAGVEYQLPITERSTNTASHGLVFTQGFTLHEHTESSLGLCTVLEPQRGYPWRLRIEERLSLSEDGLTHRITATNLSADAAPFGMAVHPYFLVGPEHNRAIDEWSLTVPAASYLRVDERMLPVALESVSSGEGTRDYRTARRIGEAELDTAFTDLTRGKDGRVHLRLSSASGADVDVWLGEGCSWVQVFTAHKSVGNGFRGSLAIEPMTCPADAFNSGRDLRVLEPGDATVMEWGVCRAV